MHTDWLVCIDCFQKEYCRFLLHPHSDANKSLQKRSILRYLDFKCLFSRCNKWRFIFIYLACTQFQINYRMKQFPPRNLFFFNRPTDKTLTHRSVVSNDLIVSHLYYNIWPPGVAVESVDWLEKMTWLFPPVTSLHSGLFIIFLHMKAHKCKI